MDAASGHRPTGQGDVDGFLRLLGRGPLKRVLGGGHRILKGLAQRVSGGTCGGTVLSGQRSHAPEKLGQLTAPAQK